MSEPINQLLLAALKRAGKPLGSDELLDQAFALALNERWKPEGLTRKSVAKRCTNLETKGLIRIAGWGRDDTARRDTPMYEPTDGFDAHAPVPNHEPSAARAPGRTGDSATVYEGMTARQRLAVFEAQDMVLESLSRLLGNLQTGLADMSRTQEKARRLLLAEGLEPR